MLKNKCDTCSTINQGFHLCLGKKPEYTQKPNFRHDDPEVRAARARENSGTVQRQRWEQYHAQFAERNAKIVELRETGMPLHKIADVVGIKRNNVITVLKRHREKESA